MSTKTTFKRVALVAVASLGFGMLSVGVANAVVPTHTAALGTITPADGSVVVGTLVTIPMNITIAALTEDTASTATFTATFTQKPVNTTLAAAGLSANVTGSGFATAGATLSVASAATNVITMTSPASDVAAVGPLLAGNFTFTPDTPGIYKVAVAKGNAADTVTGVADIVIIVRGAALTQAASGKGNNTGTAVVGGSAVAVYHVPGAAAAAAVYNVTSSGVGSISNPLACATLDATLEGTDTAVRCSAGGSGTVASINGTNYTDGVKFTNTTALVGNVESSVSGSEASASFTVDASSSIAGVQTITYTGVNQSTGVPTAVATVTITWGATAGTAANAQFSTAWMTAGTTLATLATDGTADGVSCSKSTLAAQCANILVTVKDINGVALNNASLSATVTGPGLLGLDVVGNAPAVAASGRVVATAAAGLTTNLANISVRSDGTAGTATIVIKSGTVTLATKTIIFYGTVAKLVPTQSLSIARAGVAGYQLGCGAADCSWLTTVATPAVYIEALDADGMVVPGLTITAVSSDSSVIVSSTITQDDATAGDGPGYYNASVSSAPGAASGAKATVTFRTLLSTGAYVSTDALAFTLGGITSTMKIALDKSSYAPGEAMVVTRTALDASGNAVYDGVASPAVSFTKAVGGSAPAAGEFNAGKSASSATRPSVFAPSLDGPFQARMSYTTAAGTTAVAADATVTDVAGTAAATAAADAAAEATDAANAATDAANAAAEAADAATAAAQDASDAVAALSAQVATLIAGLKAQLTALTNLVIKIQKKVKA